MRTVIGIDPGLQNTGYGIVSMRGNRFLHVTHGTITTRAVETTANRLQVLFRELTLVIKQYGVEEAGIEDIYFARNARSVIPVAAAKGVLMLACAECGLPVTEYSPLVIKRAVTGNGRAEKQQVQEIVKLVLGLPDLPSPDHAADALAAALCHLQQKDFDTLADRAIKKSERKPRV